MKKDYLIPSAILVGSIIIAIAIYLGTTAKERKQFKFCMESNAEAYKNVPKKDVEMLCKNLQYRYN